MRNLDESKEKIQSSVSSAKLLFIEHFYLCFTQIIWDVFKHCTLATSGLNHPIHRWVGFLWPQPCSKEQLVPSVAELVLDATTLPHVLSDA